MKMKNVLSKTISPKKLHLRSQISYHIMLAPGMAFLLIFSFVPMLGLVMAFQDYVPAKGILGSEFVGLKHFKDLFSNSDLLKLIRNTVVIALGKILFTTLLAIVFSILLNEIKQKWLKKNVQTIVYMPHFISWVILASVFTNLFNLDGMANHLISLLGFEPLNFIGDNKLFRPFLIGTHVWKEFGYSSIVYLAAITTVDPGLHEAAAIDGASWSKRVWNVTLPAMLPVIMLMAAINMSGILSAGFDQIYNLYSVRVYETGDILDTYVYRIGLVGRQYSFGTAVGLFKSVIGMALMLGINGISKRYAHQSIF